MKAGKTVPDSIDDYIATFPMEMRKVLSRLRKTIRAAAPDAVEKISYQMPTFYQSGNLVHFAAYKNHIGFYPAPSGIRAFSKKLANFETSKGAVRFPVDKPLPLDLVRDIVRFRVSENVKKDRSVLKRKSVTTPGSSVHGSAVGRT